MEKVILRRLDRARATKNEKRGEHTRRIKVRLRHIAHITRTAWNKIISRLYWRSPLESAHAVFDHEFEKTTGGLTKTVYDWYKGDGTPTQRADDIAGSPAISLTITPGALRALKNRGHDV